jgi:hypothetical protein
MFNVQCYEEIQGVVSSFVNYITGADIAFLLYGLPVDELTYHNLHFIKRETDKLI